MRDGREDAGEMSRFAVPLSVVWWRGLALVLGVVFAFKNYDGAARVAVIVATAVLVVLTGITEVRRDRRRNDSIPTTN